MLPIARRPAGSLALALALSACAGTPPGSGPAPESPHYRAPAALLLRIEHPLPLPADIATLRFQDGRIVAFNAVEESEPHCLFEVERLGSESRLIEPVSLAVSRVQRGLSTFPGIALAPTGSGRGGPARLYYYTEFRLHRTGEDPARALFCQHDQSDRAIPRHLTPSEIRTALGPWLSLEATQRRQRDEPPDTASQHP